MNFRLTTLDRYIVRKFIGTYLAAILIIIGIVIIFDISEKIDAFVKSEAPLEAIIFQYYANFVPFFMNSFSALFVFITVIFFTSKMTANSEIVAILSGGISYNRLLYPYFISASFIAIISLILNLVIIPPANASRQEFEKLYLKKHQSQDNKDIHYRVSADKFLYMQYYNAHTKSATNFTLENLDGHTLKSKLTARSAVWDSVKNSWLLEYYYIRSLEDGDNESIIKGEELDTIIGITAQDISSSEKVVETLSYSELNELIKIQKMRGDKRVESSQIEKTQRFAGPFAAFILTLMGVALSTKKKRGGLGINLGVGIALSFSYILFMRFSQIFVISGALPPWFAMWLPNIIFAAVALVLYRIAPK